MGQQAKRFKANLTYANVMSTLAVVIAIAGGTTAMAASVSKNSVTTKSIKNGSVTAKDLAKISYVYAQGGSRAAATCPKNSQILSGGGEALGGGSLRGSTPFSDVNLGATRKTWWAFGGGPSTSAVAVCLSTKPGK